MINRLNVEIILIILGCFTVSCNRYAPAVKDALSFAGNNRTELEKVLNHYLESDTDSLKFKAACYLVENMIPYFSVDSMETERFRPFYKIYDSISVAYYRYPYPAWLEDVTAAWEKYKQHTPPLKEITEKNINRDLSFVKAGWLIEQIDLAFEAWQTNVHTKNDSFEEFCEYILPYRRQNGVMLDNARRDFYLQLKDSFFKRPDYHFMYECDRLFDMYRNMGYSWDQCPDLPVLSMETLIYLQKGSCYQRAWFNTVLLSSLGMATAIDFVPRWANRSPHHSWNVIRVKGKSYPFDPFTLGTHWENGTIYDNRCIQERYGKWRLPKVFRYTFSNRMEGPGRDKRVSKSDVPPVFQNTRIKDVSEEYFETENVTLQIPVVPPDTYYAYLCVLGDNLDWIPVFWGEIKSGKVTFEKMGKDIVYMPAFYKNGEIMPVKECDPFWLKPDGTVEYLKDRGSKQTVYLRETNGDNIYMQNQENLAYLKQSVFLGKSANNTYDTLSVIPDSMGIYRLKLEISGDKKYRFIRLQLPTPVLGTCDITFYELNGKDPIKNVRATGKFTALPDRVGEQISWVTDGIAATGYLGKAINEKMNYMDFDLGDEYRIGRIGYIPYIDSNMKKGQSYSLYFWDRGQWNFVDRQEGNELYIGFKDVPAGALYTVKSSTPHKLERIFTYEDNEALWH